MDRAALDSLARAFADAEAPTRPHYEGLFTYFLAGYLAHASPRGATARYPGMPSANGPAMDRLEGFSRIAPLLAAWLHGGGQPAVRLPDGRSVDLAARLREAIVAGTDPESPEYWGDIKHWGQAIVEAADIALALWLARGPVWDRLDPAQQAQAARWLAQVNGKRIPDNNWHLFVAQVDAVLAALGQPVDGSAMASHYERAKSFYRGNGWFEDGAMPGRPSFDYYNAWGFHYQLQWLARIDPALDARFIDESLAGFAARYRYFFGPQGFPIMGRSACYRMAAPVALVFAQAAHPEVVSPGEARRAVDTTWQYFIRNGALAEGNVTQGYFGTDARIVENYSGPASCLWSLRSLVAAFALPADSAFWTAPPEPLPVERGDFELQLAEPGWVLVGDRRSGAITIRTGHPGDPPLEPHRLTDRMLTLLTGKPRRPKNHAAKYYRSRYDSARPFCIDS